MREYFYLLSGNIDPSRDTDKIHLDMLNASGRENPHVLLLATASTGTDWHENYKANISAIFAKYRCTFTLADEDKDLGPLISEADIVYFLGGSPYKHTRLNHYRDLFRKVRVKAGTSAGAIYLGYHTFFVGKDDYVLAVPGMLGFVDLHILPHSETHKEEMVSNYLANEANISLAKLYNQAGLKIESDNGIETVTALMGGTENSVEKIEMVLKNRTYFKAEEDRVFNLGIKLIND
jgi:hypothetical protein